MGVKEDDMTKTAKDLVAETSRDLETLSGGCVRLLNQDVIDLYQRIPTGWCFRTAGVPEHRRQGNLKNA